MDYIRLGRSGLKISRIVLGCMSYGVGERGNHPWTLGESDSRPFIRKALDFGINCFDTANMYSDGTSEEIVGKILKEMVPRDEIVIATKVYGRMRPGPNGIGLSRKAILAEAEASLRRLGTDYIDLYQIHFWDNDTPIDETLEALNDLVRSGKVRYIGASNVYAWQFAKALYRSDANSWTRFVSLQCHLNLLYREEEREMLPLCRDEGVGVIAFSPLARGRLTRPWTERSSRSDTDNVTAQFYGHAEAADRSIVDAVTDIAMERRVAPAHVALAWVAAKAGVTAPIVGATKTQHLDDAIEALGLKLTSDEIARLEERYVPHTVVGLK
ncbi:MULTISPECIES: aldo/keto reductase [Bradyrhizobium]|jgi:1-deoxyxylulose-5-phosphate synthase|uniref:Aryl-alcohol dehydrogenase-like predicted oxidoreductase n=1 Tax=Bradyrhizobium elkanii TaxID=29448 RepID=A0ABV4EQQ4_BRAEL|nr:MULTISPECIES: aldo/keto reductase [Bradyrhizobium]MCP1758751.1 aryl-alcohol dehydrogenase-like predicted oxidoreductase [Bradyrhizobium elkanii]MCP1975770.1 aryl-alcohol dehydrogenase-like predicted oxidoreductase [Bradyrhizobium elkanii]MCP1984948.1 aryl-alcohol dehydrogenase-like predicted oxidoreductase [Bradyrhizobium elkanii]MCS3695293.1 aryl-alcohol dehydrogenase-like predicted oxidoreductase [Bradyrhizobium elkanii]MCS3890698.1 aryl-alcohol dehydrogenase-like predicted oxidoreductase